MAAPLFRCVAAAAVVLLVNQGAQAAPDVQLRSGTARGFDRQATETGRPYYAYYGIPFAEPPVGELRFLPPRPYGGRGPGTVITSSTFRNACYQPTASPSVRMSEDCLHLNIFTPPDADTGRLYKVMVWVHGGGFVSGEASIYGPSRMVTDKEVIVVSIQYRLGAFGFLSSGDEALPGNLGLHDQVLALRWVKDNIRQFGGDSDDITIFGESAGSASVAALVLTPATKGLFTKGIMQSGTMLSPWALIKRPQDQFYQHSKNLGCFPRIYNPWNKVGYHKSIVKCMKTKSPQEILNAQEGIEPADFFSKSVAELDIFAPVVDGDLLPQAPASLLSDKAYLQRNGVLDRSYIMGMNDNEALLTVGFVPRDARGNFTLKSNVASLVRSTVKEYLDWPPESDALNLVDFVYTFPRDARGNIPLQNVLNLISETSYAVPTVVFARALVEASPSTQVYMYMFDAEPKLKDPNGPFQGTNHAMDIYHLFDIAPNEIDELIYFYADPDPIKFPIIADAFRGVVTSFAKTGFPATDGFTSWPRFDLRSERYVALSTQPEVRERLLAQRMALWTEVLPKMRASYWTGAQRGRVAYN